MPLGQLSGAAGGGSGGAGAAGGGSLRLGASTTDASEGALDAVALGAGAGPRAGGGRRKTSAAPRATAASAAATNGKEELWPRAATERAGVAPRSREVQRFVGWVP